MAVFHAEMGHECLKQTDGKVRDSPAKIRCLGYLLSCSFVPSVEDVSRVVVGICEALKVRASLLPAVMLLLGSYTIDFIPRARVNVQFKMQSVCRRQP